MATILAQVLSVAPEAAEAPPRDLPAARQALAEARVAYADTLDRSDFREDAPAMRALAESVAPLLIDTWRRHDGLRDEARELMQATAGAALRPLLEESPELALALSGPWARWHERVDLRADAPEPVRDRAQRALALYWPGRGSASLLASLLRDAPTLHRDGLCRTALLLPPTERRALLARAVVTLTAQGPRDNEPACIRLAVEHPAGRRWLQSALLDPRGDAPATIDDRWAPIAAVLLAASGPVAPRVAAQLARWTEQLRRRADVPTRRALVTAMERQSPSWPATAPGRRATVLAFVRAMGTDAVRLWPLRHALGDPSLPRDARDALASPSANPFTLAVAVRAVGLTTPDDPRARAEAIEALDLLRSRLRPWGIDAVSPREIDRWRAALDDARPCDETCAETLATATDPTAARTVMLGAPLERAAVARVVVRRVVSAGESFVNFDGAVTSPSALAAVVLALPRACAPALRGLATVRPAQGDRPRSSWLDPWRDHYVARCTREARRP
ncbi:MAG: hypothetical protein Q8S73_08880 [Deltaproteobacteria bacterium]|nr:hypothetical protein [Myxococcales bacterium]MDP3214204.1 hypothetical protein [Deltaproteobacteria bacterium]